MPYSSSATRYLGQTIDNGALRIEAILGAGSFGVVYRAVDTRSGAYYAVKRVEKNGFTAREAQLHKRVSFHPNVLTFHRYVDAGYYIFFVYDLCAGDLDSVIRRLTFFRDDELIKRVFVQIIDALDFCHSRGIYHRDLKPENILVSSQSGEIEIFIADFGLATTNRATESSCGTPCYMCPESLVPHHTPYGTAEGDIWALGCILSEMLANVRPWYSATPEDRDYSGFLKDNTSLGDVLPVSDLAYSLLVQIFTPDPKYRPSLEQIRKWVLNIDTFFLTEREAALCGWGDRYEKRLLRKMIRSRSSDRTCSGSPPPCKSTVSRTHSSSVFESVSLASASTPPLPATPPAPAGIFHSFEKAPSRLELERRLAAAQTA